MILSNLTMCLTTKLTIDTKNEYQDSNETNIRHISFVVCLMSINEMIALWFYPEGLVKEIWARALYMSTISTYVYLTMLSLRFSVFKIN